GPGREAHRTAAGRGVEDPAPCRSAIARADGRLAAGRSGSLSLAASLGALVPVERVNEPSGATDRPRCGRSIAVGASLNRRSNPDGVTPMERRERKKATDFPPEVLKLFDGYVHGMLSRRDFLDRAAKYAVGGFTAAAMLESLRPNYAWAQQIPKNDPRIKSESPAYPSPQGSGNMRGYFARPA